MLKLLTESQVQKLKNSASYEKLRQQLSATFVEIPPSTTGRKSVPGSAFRIMKHHVTNDMMSQFLNAILSAGGVRNETRHCYLLVNTFNPNLPLQFSESQKSYEVREGFLDHPVCGISWSGANYFASLFDCGLPSEMQWEHAARGSSPQPFPWGSQEPSEELANFEEKVGSTVKVMSYKPNAFDVYDMAGNAEDWCIDPFIPGSKSTLTESRYIESPTRERVVKGGGWNKPSSNMLVEERRGKWERIGTVSISFRLVAKASTR